MIGEVVVGEGDVHKVRLERKTWQEQIRHVVVVQIDNFSSFG